MEMANYPDREQARERANTMRIVGGLFLIVALLLYFFHLAEVPMGQHIMGVLSGLFGVIGAALLWVGRRRIRELR
jgi:hypothetical protein